MGEMLPPVDDEVLGHNPGFASLWCTLVNVVFNPDGSTQHDPAAEERAAVREELDRRRLFAAKQHLLERAVATAAPPESTPPPPSSLGQPRRRRPEPSAAGLPDPLLDLVLALPPLLETRSSLAPESAALLLSSPPLSHLGSLLPDLAALVSSSLHSSALGLARLVHPTINPSYLHRHISSLPKDHAALSDSLSAAQQSLAAVRLRALASLAHLLHCYTQSLTHLVRALEAKHGVVARSLELHASHVSLQARRTEMEASNALCNLGNEVYSPQAVAALRKYAQHLHEAGTWAAERMRSLQAELGGYGVGTDGAEDKEEVTREMTSVYRETRRQMEHVKKDLDRLHEG